MKNTLNMPVTILKGFLELKAQYIEHPQFGLIKPIWLILNLKKDGKILKEVAVDNISDPITFNFFKKNIGNYVGLIFEKTIKNIQKFENGYNCFWKEFEENNLINCYVLDNKKNTYFYQGFLKNENDFCENSTNYYSIDFEPWIDKSGQNNTAVGIEIKSDNKYASNFKKCANTKNIVKITFEKISDKILDFEIIK